jgi:UDP-glucose 4-epimerase
MKEYGGLQGDQHLREEDSGKSESRAVDSLSSHFRGLKAVVTGGMGFIGSNLARRLADWGSEVAVVDSMEPNTGANPANLRGFEDRITICKHDLRDCAGTKEIFEGQDVVFNLAGRVSHIDSMTDPVSDLSSNVHGQVVLLEACRKHAPNARIVFASTRQIYGKPNTVPVDESHPLQPIDINGIHKMAAEAYHSLYHRIYGMQIVSLRLTNTYGPRMRVKDARQTFLGIWLRRAIDGEVIEVWGGDQMRDLTYVDDALDAFCLAAVCPAAQGRILNVGGSPPVTLLELAEMLIAIAGNGRIEIKEFPPDHKRIDIGDYFADDKLLRGITGWSPRVALRDGLTRTLEYFRHCLSDYV